LNQPTRCSN